MEISRIDANFLQTVGDNPDRFDYYNPTKPPFSLYGVFYDEPNGGYRRMTQEIADQINPRVAYLNTNTAGGRIRFSTDSGVLRIEVTYKELCNMSHMPLRGSSGFALTQNKNGKEVFVASVGPEPTDALGYTREIKLPKSGKNYTLHFPLYQAVDSLVLGFDKGAKVGQGAPYRPIDPILYYGSSITQGGCASRADMSYQGQISRKNNVNYVNLGFSGNAKAEPVLVDYLAKIPCSIAVLDYDHNAPSAAFLEETHYAMYERFRKAQPDTPIVLVSRPDWYNGMEEKKRLQVVQSTYERARTAGDGNVYFINGKTFFGKDWDICTVDGCHPTDLGFYKMAAKIGKTVNEILDKSSGKKSESSYLRRNVNF